MSAELQGNLEKSLDAIEAAAEAILSKSEEVDKVDKQKDLVEDAAKAKAEGENEDKVEKSVKADDVADGDDDGNDSGDEDDKEDPKEDKDVEKSMREQLEDNEEIAKSIDASEFLSEFSRVQSRVVDSLSLDVKKSLKNTERVSEVLSKSFEAIMKSQNGLTDLVKSQAAALSEQADLIKSLQERLDDVERQPVGRKAVVDIMEKSFNQSAGLPEPGKKELNKSEKLARMNNLLMKGQPGITVNDIIKYESTGIMTDQVKDLVENN